MKRYFYAVLRFEVEAGGDTEQARAQAMAALVLKPPPEVVAEAKLYEIGELADWCRVQSVREGAQALSADLVLAKISESELQDFGRKTLDFLTRSGAEALGMLLDRQVGGVIPPKALPDGSKTGGLSKSQKRRARRRDRHG